MSIKSLALKALETGKGILRLIPAWVPRSFCRPGRRLKLHPGDYYALGLDRGGIDERWLASTTHADNGPLTPEDEGLSYIAVDEEGKERLLLKDVIELLKEEIIGGDLWKKYGGWPIFAKFFDNYGPLAFHVHHRQIHAERVKLQPKPEMYFYPAQLNNYGGEFPFTFFGFNPNVTKEQVREALMNFNKGDNNILSLSRAYKLTLDTGWDVPAGVLHAPGSLCTYEPQLASDISAVYQSVLYHDNRVDSQSLWLNCPPEEVGNFDYLVELLDWELNVDPDFYENRFMAPKSVKPREEMVSEGYIDEWICYKSSHAKAKRLTVLPSRTVTIKDNAAYGLICIQGHGKFGSFALESPTMIRFGQLTNDELFVTEKAAKEGITVSNYSSCENLVILRHYAENVL